MGFKLISVSVPFSAPHAQVSRSNQEPDGIPES